MIHLVPAAPNRYQRRSGHPAIKQAARRLKLRYREILRTEIANTVDSRDDIDDELRQLMNALSG